ncbi:hypothetical protein [Promicromonospora sp. NPDC060271]|uniref:hypothetical protein n=1 Tax=Promicromonospora sp. NPDC060271 TaxID=3347089 RepID=UPI003656E312
MVRIDAQAVGIEPFLDEGDSFMSVFNALFIIIPIIFVGMIVLMIVLAVLNARRLRSKGISPLATEAEIVADAVRGSTAQRPGAQPAARPAQTLEARLAEIEQLHATGKITTAERDAARVSVLGTL